MTIHTEEQLHVAMRQLVKMAVFGSVVNVLLGVFDKVVAGRIAVRYNNPFDAQ